MRLVLCVIAAAVLVWGEIAQARGVPLMLEVSGGYHFLPNRVSAPESTLHFAALVGPLYLGVCYEYWFPSANVGLTKFHGAGLELGGVHHWNPRMYGLFTFEITHPIQSSESTTTFATQARVALGIQIYSYLSFLLEGGYRLNKFRAPSTVSLSGPWAGVGLGFHF